MTQEDKQLLLKDLSSRLPYGVIVRHADCIIDNNYNETGEFHYTKGYLYDICRMDDMTTTIIESEGESEGYEHICDLERSLPYLRPMSSMTEEERIEFSKLLVKRYCEEDWEGHISTSYCIEIDNVYTDDENGIKYPSVFSMDAIDWLNKHHFDYRGIIPMGLALEAPEGMYETEKQ